VPRNWSVRGWFEEIRAHSNAALWQALCDFDPSRGVPLEAFIYQRVIASAFTRYRQEWIYVLKCVSVPDEKDNYRNITANSLHSIALYESLRPALARLSEVNRWLIEQMFWERCTEAEIAQKLGISRPAVNKRKRAILRDLRSWLRTPEKI
jgi:RNA polymerase sigma factor (sigma-70 family)